jgi:uncharacterized membrane protein YedE/YeeE
VLLAAAAVIVLAGAFSRSLELDVAYVAGTLRGVSAFWIALALAALLLLAGLLAAWFSRRSAMRSCRKLEAELETTYQRLREAEARAFAAVGLPEIGLPAGEHATRVIAPSPREDDTVILHGSHSSTAAGSVDQDEDVTQRQAPAPQRDHADAQDEGLMRGSEEDTHRDDSSGL